MRKEKRVKKRTKSTSKKRNKQLADDKKNWFGNIKTNKSILPFE